MKAWIFFLDFFENLFSLFIEFFYLSPPCFKEWISESFFMPGEQELSFNKETGVVSVRDLLLMDRHILLSNFSNNSKTLNGRYVCFEQLDLSHRRHEKLRMRCFVLLLLFIHRHHFTRLMFFQNMKQWSCWGYVRWADVIPSICYLAVIALVYCILHDVFPTCRTSKWLRFPIVCRAQALVVRWTVQYMFTIHSLYTMIST